MSFCSLSNLYKVLMLLLFCAACCLAEELTDVCRKVHDGDTVTLSSGDRVRLYGIDAPELEQDFGRQSRDHLASIIAGKTIRVSFNSRDKYGRILGRIYTADGTDVNLAMLEAGMAWHFTRYDQSPAFARAERAARTAKRGLWAAAAPVPPWDYRHAPKVTTASPDTYWVAGKVHNSSCKHYGEGKTGYETTTPPADKPDGKCCGGRHPKR